MNAGVKRYEMGQLVDGEHLPPPKPKPITNTATMRRFLLNQMELAAAGKITTEQVKNVCALAQQVYQATKLELEAARLLNPGNKSASLRTLELADDE